MSLRALRHALALACAAPLALFAQPSAPAPEVTILRPARVFDGDALHEGWAVRVRGGRLGAGGRGGARSARAGGPRRGGRTGGERRGTRPADARARGLDADPRTDRRAL